MRSVTKYGAGGAALIGISTIGAATVFACTSTPTLNISSPGGGAGSAVTVTGSSFGTTGATNSAVVLRWDGANGPVLGTAAADQTGAFGPVPVTIPVTAEPGYHLVIGSRASEPTRILSRAQVEVSGPVAGGSHPVADRGTQPAGSGIAPGVLAAAAVLGLGGLTLLGVGAGSMIRGRRVPALVRTRSS